jgi:predicted SprT family Zn-dependent metalloprotease
VAEDDDTITVIKTGGRPMTDEAATMFAPDDANYVIVCTDCKTSDWTQQDCKTTRAVRRGEAACADCGAELTMVRDKQEDPDQ